MRLVSQTAAALTRSPLGGFVLRLAERTPLRRHILSAVVDPETGTFVGSGDMERDWDERARRNARFFVAGYDWRSEEEFRQSGERDLEAIILKGIELPSDTIALEIGCGLGRLMRPMSKRVREVHGVDISSEMVSQAVEALSDCPNAHVHHTEGDLTFLGPSRFDFCYSYVVFQHISQKDAVLRYFSGASEVLKPGSLFRFQICRGEEGDSRSKQGGSWLGVVFSEQELRSALEARGFNVVSLEIDDTPALRDRWDSVIVTCRKQ